MKSINVILWVLFFHPVLWAQPQKRNGWIFGTAAGVSAVHLSGAGFDGEMQGSLSFPNFRVGRMISERSAVLLYLPGSIYREKHDGRERDRGFEGLVPVYQFWPAERWWIMGGIGLTLDAPAFYDIGNESERAFYFGPLALAAAGFEIWRRNRFALDVQARAHYGAAQLREGNRSMFAANVLIGANWYFGRKS
jgi:hypothetical protein